MNIVFLSLGSNLGERTDNLKKISRYLTDEGISVVSQSSILETEPWGVTDEQDKYLNQVIKIETDLYPFGLLNLLQEIEKKLGRTEKGNLKPRTADIDILFFNDWKINSDRLQIPHKYFSKRPFVMEPMLEIAPDFTDPVSGKTIKQLLTQNEV